ncbi:hypothetical protein HO173_005343 [Letharia columbiana]|uniref:Uncharacterized protein n=1 Tax=Letharia columbiana TaxID=112416 RepID=A0A8H6FXE7_9LECA|nr:uncharacterized protein HO173_005343 [Letharia columbiana]KAF6236562.1 hypothetical protein HO173_005343 [Letharia columbiana]
MSSVSKLSAPRTRTLAKRNIKDVEGEALRQILRLDGGTSYQLCEKRPPALNQSWLSLDFKGFG